MTGVQTCALPISEQALYREVLALRLGREGDFEVLADTADLLEADRLARELCADVVIVDEEIAGDPLLSGQGISIPRSAAPISIYGCGSVCGRTRNRSVGAHRCVTTHIHEEELICAIREVAAGHNASTATPLLTNGTC